MEMIRRRFRAAVLMGAAASALVFAGGAMAQDKDADHDQDSHSNEHKSPVLAVVGDISCQPGGEIELSSTASANGTVLNPADANEAKNEFCFNPKPPYTATSLWQSQEATANQIEQMKPDAVALTGDLQYQVGQFQDFQNSYELTYGAFKKITRPSPGNHEFYDEHNETGVAGYGYFSYFNGYQITAPTPTMTGTAASGTLTSNPAMPIMTTIPDPCPVAQKAYCNYPGLTTPNPQPIPRSDGQAGHFEQLGGGTAITPTGGPVGVGDGWYSYNLGGWHLISLNIECSTQPGACSFSGGTWLAAETAWLKEDLEENHSVCTLAYWHQPTYSGADSLTQEGITAGTWWQMLYDAGADLVLNGHDHLYARYAPIKPYFDASDTSVAGVTGTWLGTSDPKRGIREIIVGTGGETLDTLVTAPCTSATCTAPVTPTTDYDGLFNKQFLENGTGYYWGVMGLTLDPDGYKWDFESAPTLPAAPVAPAGTAASFSDTGSAKCHGGPFGNNLADGDDHGKGDHDN